MVTIDIRNPDKLPGLYSAFISMDTFNEILINELRSLDLRKYDTKLKTWEIPVKELKRVIDCITNDKITINLSINKFNKSSIPQDYVFKTTPYDYQLDGIEYGLGHNKFILGDMPGLGKTLQASNIAAIRNKVNNVNQCLVVCCVNSLKFNWLEEIQKHTNMSCRILGTKHRKNGNAYIGSTQDKIYDINNAKEFFLITNIETLRNDDVITAIKRNKNINMLVIDEFHKVTNHTSQQSHNLLKLSYIDYMIALTGTPVINKPLDVFTALKLLGIEKSNYSTFKNFYCEFGGFGNHEVIGYRNLSVLKESLSSCMLRRRKEEVLTLPPKIIQNEFVELTPNQQKIYDNTRQWVLDNIDLIVLNPNPLTQLLRLRQAAGYTGILSSEIQESVKFDRCEDLVEEITQNNEKVILLSNWTSITNPLYERLKKYNPVLITGEIKDTVRSEYNHKFQTDPNCKVCIGTIGAMGVGLTFNAGSYAIFLDLPWNYADYEQACDRLHRIGQKNTVNIVNLIAKNTIDERILELIYTKKDYADMLVDGKTTKMNKDLLLSLI